MNGTDPQMQILDEVNHKSVSLLHRLFEVTDGNTEVHLKIIELGQEVGLSQTESYEAVSRLQEEGLVTIRATDGRVGITQQGVSAVTPSSAGVTHSDYVPVSSTAPSNVINIYGNVNGSPIQQGTQQSTQEIKASANHLPSQANTIPQRQEKLYVNLLPITSYPPRIFIADTFYRYRGDLFREIMRLTDKPNGVWILRGGRIITFCDLYEYPWRQLCDPGTVEGFDSEEWSQSSEPNERRIFSELIKFTLQDTLYKKYIGFDREKKIYYFRTCGKRITRRLYYQSQQNRVSREIIKAYPNAKEPRYYRHYAFKGMPRYIERSWHLEISPTHYYTSDGFHRYAFDENLLSGLKRLEGNGAVLGQLIMWSRLLTEQDDMFGSEEPFLRFGNLPVFTLEGGFDDATWGKREAANSSLLDPAQQEMEFVNE
jgi:hypothetical protein